MKTLQMIYGEHSCNSSSKRFSFFDKSNICANALYRLFPAGLERNAGKTVMLTGGDEFSGMYLVRYLSFLPLLEAERIERREESWRWERANHLSCVSPNHHFRRYIQVLGDYDEQVVQFQDDISKGKTRDKRKKSEKKKPQTIPSNEQ